MRYFLPLTLLLAITVACHNPAATGVSVNSAFRPLIPPDTRALAAADLDRLKASAFYKRHQAELNFPLLDATSERLGLDPRRDLSDVLIACNGKESAILARGRFEQQALEPKLLSFGLRREQYRGYTLFGDNRNALAFAKHGVAVAGTADTVRGELDLQSNGGGGVPDELRALLAATPKDAQIWAVTRGELGVPEMLMRSDIESALSNFTGYVRGATFGMWFDAGTHVAADIFCVSDQGAQRVRDGLRGGIGLARLTTRDNEWDLLRLYDSIQVSQEQQTIHVKADFSASLTDKLLTYLPQIRNRAGAVLRQR